MPNYVSIEIGNPVDDAGIAISDTKIEGGQAVLGDKPGLGIEIDREVLAAKSVDKIPPGSGPSPFGRRPGAGLYEVPPTEAEVAEANRGTEGQAEGRHAY